MRHIAALLPALCLAACTTAPPGCAPPGHWINPTTLRTIPAPEAAGHKVILLGEQHDSAADHHWQLSTIERLYAADPSLVLGFEMFPRAAQPVLNLWVAGKVSEPEFLARSDWAHAWGFPPELYLPIFRFARDHHIPMLALNVSHRIVHLVAEKGWAATKTADREGLSTPSPPSPAYRASLAEAMSGHGGPPMTPERLSHFIDAQLVWDRAMAEAIATQHAQAPNRLIVALMGAGHLEHRHGVPHQLEALGVANAMVLLPEHEVCSPWNDNYADAIFTN